MAGSANRRGGRVVWTAATVTAASIGSGTFPGEAALVTLLIVIASIVLRIATRNSRPAARPAPIRPGYGESSAGRRAPQRAGSSRRPARARAQRRRGLLAIRRVIRLTGGR